MQPPYYYQVVLRSSSSIPQSSSSPATSNLMETNETGRCNRASPSMARYRASSSSVTADSHLLYGGLTALRIKASKVPKVGAGRYSVPLSRYLPTTPAVLATGQKEKKRGQKKKKKIRTYACWCGIFLLIGLCPARFPSTSSYPCLSLTLSPC